MKPLETAIYWTEHVIRHKGAYHLRSPAADLTWYQLYLLDIMLAALIIVLICLVILYYLIIISIKNKFVKLSKKTKKKKT